ncbi:MAG: prepilin-type N-terminal cleavage/methylation domain-containing protein [Candidatus Omnitrophota bacterium]
MKRAIIHSTKGMTLIEAMMATAIIAIAFGAIGGLILNSYGYVDHIRATSVAIQAIQEELEIVRNTDYDNILIMGGAFNTAGLNTLTNGVGAVTVDNPLGDNDIRRVTITVSWTSRIGQAMTRTIATLVTREGINRQ